VLELCWHAARRWSWGSSPLLWLQSGANVRLWEGWELSKAGTKKEKEIEDRDNQAEEKSSLKG